MKLDKGRLSAVSPEAKVTEFLFLETSKKGASLWTGSAATYPRAGGETRDWRIPSREQGCRGRQSGRRGCSGAERGHSMGFLIGQGGPQMQAGRHRLCGSLLAQGPLRSGSTWEAQDRAGPLCKGTLGFFLENQQEEEATDARLLAHAIGPGQWGGHRVGPRTPEFESRLGHVQVG